MKIRKLIYNIDFIHIITFKDYYKEIIAPYFVVDGLQYAIENENSIHESIKLIFAVENFTLQFKKDGATLIFEGDPSEVKKSNPILTIYFDIIDKIKKIAGFTKIHRHKLVLFTVDILEKEKVSELLVKNKFIYNPYGKLTEFAIVHVFDFENKNCRLQFGNFSFEDIAKYDLTPFQTEYNDDLTDKSLGIMSQFTVSEKQESNYSFTKFKLLLEQSETILSKFEISK